MASSLNLPEELIIEIMSWLPPESLIQFKCVGKYWYKLVNFLLEDPSFVAKHLRNQNDSNIFSSPNIAVSCLHIYDTPVYSYKELFALISLSNSNQNDTDSSVAEDLNLPIIPGEKDMSCLTVSHCNGIVCVADYYHNIILSNQAMKKSRVLPKPGLMGRFVLQGVGFGYDSGSNDYKVVRFGRDHSLYPRAEVYSLRFDSWKEIGIDSGTDYFPSLHIDTYFNGAFYWLMSGPRFMIQSFDMSDEVFRTEPLPEILQTAKSQWMSLGVWNDSVALFFCPGGKGTPVTVDIWVMKECVNGRHSWKKGLTIGPFKGIDCPLGFCNEEEFVMRSANYKEVVSYNVRTHNLRNIKVEGLDGIGCRAFSYVKSLVSVQTNKE
ncbi:F-box/kelch-repeat protein At3g06240-like [Humulus lupulus]|uniref:F-box/kelch-repeat protein At3g06240-like n=1 Tax=Humulus lupulus TaxID=3486 RepID=UPI002B411991|nr:F-box/kelch-repeat protein At3g06240-like [Humulus lupulus]